MPPLRCIRWQWIIMARALDHDCEPERAIASSRARSSRFSLRSCLRNPPTKKKHIGMLSMKTKLAPESDPPDEYIKRFAIVTITATNAQKVAGIHG